MFAKIFSPFASPVAFSDCNRRAAAPFPWPIIHAIYTSGRKKGAKSMFMESVDKGIRVFPAHFSVSLEEKRRKNAIVSKKSVTLQVERT